MAADRQSLAELHTRARELGLEGYRMLAREELIEAIERAEAGAGGAAGPDLGRDDEQAPEPRRRRRRGRRGGRGRGGSDRARETGQDQPRRGSRAERDRRERGEGEREEGREELDEDGREELDEDGREELDEDGREERDDERREERDDERREEQDEGEREDEGETEPVSGVLDRMPQGYGFLRLSGLDASEGDVYVSASQIRRCELRAGDQVSGPARPPRRGERHRALVRVESVNGQEPEGERSEFEDLTAVAPWRRLELGEAEPLVRAVDLLTPLALGQRVLVLAEPRSGRTTLLRQLARALTAAGTKVRVLLADERPEEATEWERAAPGAEISAATADQEPAEQVRAMELAMGHAKRGAESGEDVVVILDSLSRLALGYRDPARVKRLFGAGRELSGEDSGSLTVIATVLDSDERGREVAEALQTTENVLIRLDSDLAAFGIVPSLDVSECRISGEELLRSPEELEAVRALRAELAPMDPADAARELGERIASTKSNQELLG